MAVIGAAIPVFAGGASEFGHRDNHRVFGEVAKIGPERGQRLRELAKNICDLSLRAAFVHMMVPTADVGERHLHAEVRLDQLSQLFQAVAKAAAGIVGAGSRRVAGGIGGLEHLDRFEGFLRGAVHH